MSSSSDDEDSKRYKPNKEFVEYATGPLVDLNLTDSTELWLIKVPNSNDKNLIDDIAGKESSFKLNKEGTLASFAGASGETYDFLSFASTEPDETVFVSSATESKIGGKISRRVSVVHYPDPRALEKISSTNPNQTLQNSIAAATQSAQRRSHTSATKSSRAKSSISGLSERTTTPKRHGENRRPQPESSRGHSSGVSAVSSDHSDGGKSKRRKHTE